MTKEKTIIADFTTGSVPEKMLKFAFPLILSGLLQVVYSMVDMIVVGKFVGGTALSAVSVGGDVLMLLTFVSMGIANAGQIIISQYIGAGQREKVTKLIGSLFTFLLGCAVTLAVICLFIRGNILRWLNTPPEAWNYAMAYVTTCIIGLPFIYGYNLVSAILRGMGDSKRPFLFIAIASVMNLILDLIFIGVFHMAAFGAALATVIGQGVSFFCALFVLYHEREAVGFDFRLSSFRIEREVMVPLLRLGIPMMIQSASITFSKLFVNSWVNSYGYVASAVSGIGTKLDTVCNTLSQAICAAAGTMIAQNIGARKTERVPKIMMTGFLCISTFALPLGLVTFLFPRFVFGLFCTEASILEMALTYVPVSIVLFTSSAMRVPMFSLINGSGHSQLNLAVALLDGIFVRIGLAMFLGLCCGMGVYGFWYGNAASSFVPFLIGGIFFLSGKWKTRRAI